MGHDDGTYLTELFTWVNAYIAALSTGLGT